MTHAPSTPSAPRLGGPRIALLALIAVLALWFTVEAGRESWRMAHGGTGTPSSLHTLLSQHRMAVTPVECAERAPPGTSPLLAPLGHCQHTSDAYRSAGAYSLFTRHSIVGPNVGLRLLLNFIHVFGAVTVFSLLFVLALTGASRGTSRLNRVAYTLLMSSIYTLLATGLTLYLFQDAGDTNYFPRPVRGDNPFFVYPFVPVFGLSFVSAACHATLFRSVPLRLVVVQHAISLLCAVSVFPIMVSRLFTLDPSHYSWSYMVELLVLFSVYPVLDVANAWILYRTQRQGRPYDWDAHRDDNLAVLAVLIWTVLLFFVGSDKHYFFSTQLPAVYRIALDLVPATLWLASGRMLAFFRRAAAA